MSSLRLRKRRAPNIVRGGRAIPLDNNGELYYLQGRSHAQGGIDIGKNPRTGIEAEGGEIVQMKPNELRVLSAQDFIGGGVSPAKQVLAGADPDKVFNEQERFKDRHRLNDDGTKYESGGNKTYDASILPTVDVVGDYNTYWRATKKKKANQIANAVRQGTSDIAPFALGLVATPAAMGLASNGILGAAIDGASIISNPTDPLNYIPYANKINPKKVKSYLKRINASNGDITVDIINNNGYNKDVHEFYKTQWYPRFIEQLNNEKSDLLKGITIPDKYDEIEKAFPIDKYINYSDRNELKKLEDILGREITIDEAINLNKYRDKRFDILDIERRAKKAKDYISDSNNFKFNIVKDDNGADSFTFMNDVYIRESDLDRGDIIAHEIRHKINNDYDFRLNNKQIQELEKNYITDIGSNLHGGEASSHRTEKISSTEDMKYIIFDNIKNQLGRYPTREELGKALNEHGESNMRKLYNDEFLIDKSNYHKDYYNNAKRIGKEEQFYKNVGRMIDIIPSVGAGIIINQNNQKRNGGMIATINGNVKNGLITTPRKKCGGRKKAEGGTSETIYDAIDRMNKEQIALQDSIDSEYYIETDSGFVRNPNILPDLIVNNNSNKDNGGINLSDESVPRKYGEGQPIPEYLKRPSVGVLDYDKIKEQEVQDVVDRFTIGSVLPQVKTNSNKKESKTDESDSSSTGGQNQSTQSTNSNSSSSSSSQTPRRRSSQSNPNTYSVTNYEIQSDGTLKANGTRTGQGFKQYAKRKNQRTITDARVSKPWRETIGDDAEILRTIAFGDNFENKKVQDAHSRLRQETGYDPNSGRAVIHEGVSEYSRKFNDRFNLANRKLGLYTTPAGKSGDNAQGERVKKYGGRKKAKGGTTTNLERPYEDNAYGAQFDNRHYGRVEDRAYVQAKINELRGPNMVQRAVFDRGDGYLGAIDALETPELKGIDIAAPKIDLGPISQTEVPKAHTRAAQQDALHRAPFAKNYRDEIGLGLGLAGSLLDPILRGRKLRDLRSWNPYLEAPVKLKTNWNINPQLDRIRESSQEAYRDIDANTASSSNALARKQRVRNQAQYAANEQWATKENKETELINQDKINRQGVRNRNANRLNQWAADDARIRNQITLAKADNISNAIQNVVGVGLDYLGRKDFKDYVNNTKAAIAAGAPNVDDRYNIVMGLGLENPYNTGIPTYANTPYRRSRFGSRTRLNRR